MKNKGILGAAAGLVATCLFFVLGCGHPSGRAVIEPVNGAGQGFALGIDVLAAQGFAPLRGKRVGLITNQTSVNRGGEPTRLVLHRAPQVNLVALFTPEHGLDGKEPAGNPIATRRGPLTGLTAFSLYGGTRKPTAAMLAGIDVLVFDLQDIGCRSYTYISTMALAMEACGEFGKEFIVLDRPNPLGGSRIEGPELDRQWTSFVGQIPVPYVHGMTAGELAMMVHGERWMRARPTLGVIKMRGWRRSMIWRDTGLRWVPTSPNIPEADSPFYYVATGILGGATNVDIGIGTSGPFEYAGARGVKASEFTRAMQSKGFSGVTFSKYESAKRSGYEGVKLTIDPRASTDLVELDITLLAELNRRTGGRVLGEMGGSKLSLFNKVYGDDSLYHDLRRGVDPRAIAASWRPGIRRFAAQRQRYLLYGR